MNQRALNVLYVEDDVADADFALSALKDVCKAAVDVRIEKDGESAARRLGLDGEKPPEPQPRPHMILLDLNLPKLPGRDLLRLIKQSPRLKAIPVVVLSTSNLQKDVDEIYGLGAAGYFSNDWSLSSR